MKQAKPGSLFKLPVIVLASAVLASTAYAQGNSGNGNGHGPSANANPSATAKHVVENGRFAIKGNLKTRQHIYYVGDELEISVQFARGHNLLADGEADAHVVIYSAAGELSSIPVPADVGTAPRRFVRIESVDIATLPEGQYQLGLVVTVPDGDPAALEDWYGGFRGLLDSEAVYITAGPVDTDDDGDGEHDDDTDGDGIDGEEEDESDDDESDEDSTTL
ncbi:MAG: hypothetical protein SV422_12450 [Pseudomonadota bacterium]|nr:hypothetical protein [Pseudomonadota bacterium]